MTGCLSPGGPCWAGKGVWGGAGLGRVGAPGSEASESNCSKDALSPLS